MYWYLDFVNGRYLLLHSNDSSNRLQHLYKYPRDHLEIHLQDACADSLLYLSNYVHRVLMADNSICRLHNVFFIILQTFLNRLI
eukprot:UN01161